MSRFEPGLKDIREQIGNLSIYIPSPTGTDDTANIQTAINQELAKYQTIPNVINKLGFIRVRFGAGHYIVTDTITFSQSFRIRGLILEGHGYGSWIEFAPTTAGKYLFNNTDCVYGITFEKLLFDCERATLDTSFMLSTSNGGPQDIVYDRVGWIGNWDKIIDLKGSNVNSEQAFMNCTWRGSFNYMLYAGGSNISDQFLNYWFYAPSFWVQDGLGEFIHLEAGGHVKIYGGDFEHQKDTGSEQCFFRLLNPSIGTHGYGVQNFICNGLRVEHRHPKSKLIHSEWLAGNIKFEGLDNSSHFMDSAYQAISTTPVIFELAGYNVYHPIVKFDSCNLNGKFSVSSSNNSQGQIISFENTEFKVPPDLTNIGDLFTYDVMPGNGDGTKPLINLDNCRTSAGVPLNGTLNSNTSRYGTSDVKRVNLKGIWGTLPINGETVNVSLPIGSVIKRIVMSADANAVGQTGALGYTLKTSESTPTQLGYAYTPQGWYGFYYEKELNYICDTVSKCNLVLVPDSSVGQRNTSMVGYIEYI